VTFVQKVISGGQTGADQGGLMAAWDRGIKTGGSAPAGWRTSIGFTPLLEVLGLQRVDATDYRERTFCNVRDSDVTLLFGFDLKSAGSRQTYDMALSRGRPIFRFTFLSIDLASAAHIPQLEQGLEFLLHHRPAVVNVAGNRDLNGTANFDLTRHLFGQLLDLAAEHRDRAPVIE
jgi:hypothetical protein